MRNYRNKQKRFYVKGYKYFITSLTKNRFPYFQESIFCDVFVENLKLCKDLKGFHLYAWFLGHDHFHLLIQPNDNFNYSKIMQFLKRHITRDINYILFPPENRKPRLQNNKYKCFHKIISEHDQKLTLLKYRFKIKYLNKNPFSKFFWHSSFHDHYIRNSNDFDNHYGYIQRNPIKHELPSNWSYIFTSSKYENLIDNMF